MPLPRSGAPSPGQPTQVGVIENVGRSLRVESGCVSWARTGDVPRYMAIRKRGKFIIMFRLHRMKGLYIQKTSPDPSPQTLCNDPHLARPAAIPATSPSDEWVQRGKLQRRSEFTWPMPPDRDGERQTQGFLASTHRAGTGGPARLPEGTFALPGQRDAGPITEWMTSSRAE